MHTVYEDSAMEGVIKRFEVFICENKRLEAIHNIFSSLLEFLRQ